MPVQADRILPAIIGGAILLHGIAHLVALAGLLAQSLTGHSAQRITVASWLLPHAPPQLSASAAIPFWLLSALAFLAAPLSIWGKLSAIGLWRGITISGAMVSLSGIVLFSGTWPGSPNRRRSALNVAIAVAMDAAILLALRPKAGRRGRWVADLHATPGHGLPSDLPIFTIARIPGDVDGCRDCSAFNSDADTLKNRHSRQTWRAAHRPSAICEYFRSREQIDPTTRSEIHRMSCIPRARKQAGMRSEGRTRDEGRN
jgi:hypothetical protein